MAYIMGIPIIEQPKIQNITAIIILFIIDVLKSSPLSISYSVFKLSINVIMLSSSSEFI